MDLEKVKIFLSEVKDPIRAVFWAVDIHPLNFAVYIPLYNTLTFDEFLKLSVNIIAYNNTFMYYNRLFISRPFRQGCEGEYITFSMSSTLVHSGPYQITVLNDGQRIQQSDFNGLIYVGTQNVHCVSWPYADGKVIENYLPSRFDWGQKVTYSVKENIIDFYNSLQLESQS